MTKLFCILISAFAIQIASTIPRGKRSPAKPHDTNIEVPELENFIKGYKGSKVCEDPYPFLAMVNRINRPTGTINSFADLHLSEARDSRAAMRPVRTEPQLLCKCSFLVVNSAHIDGYTIASHKAPYYYYNDFEPYIVTYYIFASPHITPKDAWLVIDHEPALFSLQFDYKPYFDNLKQYENEKCEDCETEVRIFDKYPYNPKPIPLSSIPYAIASQIYDTEGSKSENKFMSYEYKVGYPEPEFYEKRYRYSHYPAYQQLKLEPLLQADDESHMYKHPEYNIHHDRQDFHDNDD
ncbi:hypothetical protein BC936DRAFT_142730 [Jimgerdemannia flammicorona]|uniref:Uncharacterized protein n=1 Tax=Jimgerdemannia flammicorona TaxID=994334 RepID=A0A433DEV0_9FUNG|nr:hypothetical protein BC936DRAFT_142730 [Jimgerdemannia flammicorona]